MDALKGEVGQVDVIVTPSTQIVDGNGQVIETEEPKPTATQLPTPTGYKLLIALPRPDEATEGGILKAKETVQMEEVGSIVGFVISMGPDAYVSDTKFPNGPYCKQGDFVLMRAYSGTRFKIHGEEFRLINDDSVEAVVDDPRGISKL